MSHEKLEYWHQDSVKVKGSDLIERHVDKTYFHPKTGHLYYVSGVIFDAEATRWRLTYHQVGLIDDDGRKTFTHLPEDFTREGRFLEVKK